MQRAREQASLPNRPIEKGRPEPGLLAHVVSGKYADHSPHYRQEQIHLEAEPRRASSNRRLEGYRGYLQADAPPAYDDIYASNEQIIEVVVLGACALLFQGGGVHRGPSGRSSRWFSAGRTGCSLAANPQHTGPPCCSPWSAHQVDPFVYLCDVIERVSVHPVSRIDELTPRRWKELRQA